MHAPLQNFDFAILEDPVFKEDAVREEIVVPLLKALGYTVSGRNRIVRSKALEHPYVSFGTSRRKIVIVPDYVLYAHGRPGWVLDAKSPKHSVDDPKHVAQAYSYAIHREIRVQWYAVCNGREFALYNVADATNVPRLLFPMAELDANWNELLKTLMPPAVGTAHVGYAKDFGLHLMKLGIPQETELLFPVVPVETFGRVAEDLYTLSATCKTESGRFMITFDFAPNLLREVLAVFPEENQTEIVSTLSQYPSMVKVGFEVIPALTVRAKRGAEILEAKKEHYIPLEVISFKATNLGLNSNAFD